jgi:putative FmdB family regulatory protein
MKKRLQMPRYSYKCNECEAIINLVHSITEDKTDCTECDEKESLQKLPSLFATFRKTSKREGQTGGVVKSSIEDFKKDLKEQKKEAIKEYEPT